MTPAWKGTVRNLQSHALPDGWQIWVWMCTQGAKKLLESYSSVVQGSCCSTIPKANPLTQENLLTTVSSTLKSPSGRPSTSCFERQQRYATNKRCPWQMSKKATMNAQAFSFHPSFLYSLSHGSLLVSDAFDMGFLPPSWVNMNQPRHVRHSTRPPFTPCTGNIHALTVRGSVNRCQFTQEVLRSHTIS